MLLECSNKGCYMKDHHQLNIDDNTVYCSACGKPINEISSFAKSALKSIGQTTKFLAKKSFSIECEHCKSNDRPVVKDGDIVCNKCGKSQNSMSPIYKNMLIEKLSNFSEEI